MFTAFSTALSALNAMSTAVDVVGNNLANLNTPGFKTNAVYFRDLISQSLDAGLGETQVGFGTGRPFTIRQFTQGALQASTGLLDAAVQGDGFFVVNNSQGSPLYTRAGNFQVDGSGYLRTNSGERVQGWTNIDSITGAVQTSGATGDIVVPVGAAKQPVPSSRFTLDLNLNSTQYSALQTTYNWDCCGITAEFRRIAIGPVRSENQFRFAFTVANVGTFGTLKRQERLY